MNQRKINKREFIKSCSILSAGIISRPYFSGILLGNEQKTTNLKLAMFQEETPRGIMCRICPNECVLKEGEISQCNNRKVIKSKLYTMAFGNPCSVNVDPIEKKPLYHFLPGTTAFSIATAGCNLACLNCQNWSISQTSPEKTRNYSLPPEQVISESLKYKCKSIAYTYSEPITFYEYSYETAKLAREAGVKNIFISNGYINREPLEKICDVLDAANIDLKSFNESTYLKLTGGKLQTVLESLKVYRDKGVWLEITNLVVPTWTDKLDEIRNMCNWLFKNGFSEIPLHFSRFYPAYKLDQVPPTPVDILNRAAKIAAEEGLKYVYIGNVPGNELSDTRCPSCNNVIIKRTGYRIDFVKINNGKCSLCGNKIAGIWT
ncbi:MAG TPA: AmmeMemoRadiSam system radical SAM enzyme [Bacteroidales bacterium]|nr:AmmeMemoRadiSam system radical SAM enzyme [Bacteroidales bacterium]HRC88729.1 AmmeMemoRadiSam system radical SAM enzyme [Bacteroidales bacterium]